MVPLQLQGSRGSSMGGGSQCAQGREARGRDNGAASSDYMNCHRLSQAVGCLQRSLQKSACPVAWDCPECCEEHTYWSRNGCTWSCQLCQIKIALEDVLARFDERQQASEDYYDMHTLLLECRRAFQSGHAASHIGFDGLAIEVEKFFEVRECFVPVSELRMTHDAISGVFCHGPHAGKTLTTLIDDLRSGALDPSTGHLVIEGAFYHGRFFSIANRRTHCLREAFGKSSEQMVQVRAIPLAPGFRTELSQIPGPLCLAIWAERGSVVISTQCQ
jgi:hypothetical protein